MGRRVGRREEEKGDIRREDERRGTGPWVGTIESVGQESDMW